MVLLGHLNISILKFPKGTKGYQIDSIARFELWKKGFDYNHGTGHGVGSFLGVHEGPSQSIAVKRRQRQRGADQYQRLDQTTERIVVNEGRTKVLVNLHD